MIAVIFKQRIIIILFLCMEKHVAMLQCCMRLLVQIALNTLLWGLLKLFLYNLNCSKSAIRRL